MLAEITIANLAIIEHLHLTFAPGFNVLTGETGAGKSIILDGLGLLLGSRATSELIRAGADETRVEGIFILDANARELIAATLEEIGIALDDDTLILARELHRGGRTVGRVNGRAVTSAVLQQIGERLVDIHGQSEHLSLLRVREHIDLLDRYGKLWDLRAQVAKETRALRKLRQELRELEKSAREAALKMDRLTFIVKEIAAAKLKPGEEAALYAERDLLAHAEARAQLAEQAHRALYGGDEEKGALDWLAQAAHAIHNLEKYDPALKPLVEQVETALASLDDLARTLRAYRDGIEFNPKRLEQIEARLDLLFRLKRKYGDTIEEILQFAESSQQELDALTHSEERIQSLREQEAQLLVSAGALAEQLSQARRQAAEKLSREMERELNDLGMAKAKFAVEINRVEEPNGLIVGAKRYAFDATGIDRVEFLVSPNPGEPLKPLAKIASGGETSRLMLALKAVLGVADRTPTLIFDEIDQGIGGRMGGVVGKKLWGLTMPNGITCHQVICVTHLPQIAAYADAHFQIRKEVVGERTVTLVRELRDQSRVDELAGMLGALTETNRKSARELLREATREKKREA